MVFLLELFKPARIVDGVQSCSVRAGDRGKVVGLFANGVVGDERAFLLLFDDPG